MNTKTSILFRTYLIGLAVVLLAAGVLYKTAYIQLVEGQRWRDQGSSTQIKIKEIQAARGSIYDANGNIVVGTTPRYDIYVDLTVADSKVFNDNIDSLSIYMSEFVDGKYAPAYYKALFTGRRAKRDKYLSLMKDIDYGQLLELKSFPIFNLDQYRGGLIVDPKHKRRKPYGMAARRTIGYVNSTRKVGVEGAYDLSLRGEEGHRLMQKMAGNIWVPLSDMEDVAPEAGQDLKVTLDMRLQEVTHNALNKAMVKHKANHGCAIVMETSTGKIKAMSNLGIASDSTYFEKYNYAIAEKTEPGSTFKLPVMLAVLEESKLSLEDTISINKGKATFYDREMLDASYRPEDFLSVRKAFEYSSNVGLAKLTEKYFRDKKRTQVFLDKLNEMGLGEQSEIDIEGETNPVIKKMTDKDWYGTTLPWMSIGYEVRLTPLQMLNFYNAVANGGKMMKPYLVEEISSFNKVEQAFEPTVLKEKIASDESLAKVQELLMGVVENGTAKNIKTSEYLIAGKTGTNLINYNKDVETKDRKQYQASFAGFFPADRPEYSVIVVVSDPVENGTYGGQVAAPVFKEIADYCYAMSHHLHASINEQITTGSLTNLPNSFKGYNEDLKTVVNELGYASVNNAATWGQAKYIDEALQVEPLQISEARMPDVQSAGSIIEESIVKLHLG